MGKHSVWRLLGEAKPISQMRGHLYEVQIAGRKVPAVVTYHPSYLLRNPVAKELGWHDILFAKKNVPQD
jgi:uracil-DNA glycosylase family 4